MTQEETEKLFASLLKSLEAAWARSLEPIWTAIERNQKTNTEAILNLQDQVAWKLSLEASAADQRMEAFNRLERNTASLDLLVASLGRAVDGFNLTRQQREEIHAATDERERGWIHTMKEAARAWQDSMIDMATKHANEIAVLRGDIGFKKQLDTIGNTSESIKQLGAQLQEKEDATSEALQVLAREVSASGKHRTHQPREDEPAHRPGGIVGAVVGVARELRAGMKEFRKMSDGAKLIFLFVLLTILGGIYLLDNYQSHRKELPAAHAEPK